MPEVRRVYNPCPLTNRARRPSCLPGGQDDGHTLELVLSHLLPVLPDLPPLRPRRLHVSRLQLGLASRLQALNRLLDLGVQRRGIQWCP